MNGAARGVGTQKLMRSFFLPNARFIHPCISRVGPSIRGWVVMPGWGGGGGGESSLREYHRLAAGHGAVVVDIETSLADATQLYYCIAEQEAHLCVHFFCSIVFSAYNIQDYSSQSRATHCC